MLFDQMIIFYFWRKPFCFSVPFVSNLKWGEHGVIINGCNIWLLSEREREKISYISKVRFFFSWLTDVFLSFHFLVCCFVENNRVVRFVSFLNIPKSFPLICNLIFKGLRERYNFYDPFPKKKEPKRTTKDDDIWVIKRVHRKLKGEELWISTSWFWYIPTGYCFFSLLENRQPCTGIPLP